MLFKARVGVPTYGDTEDAVPRLTYDGALVVQELHGKYLEQTMRGNMFIYNTAVGGAALAALGTGSAPAIWNPAGSDFIFVPVRVALGLVSTTSAVGNLEFGVLHNVSGPGTAAPVVSFTSGTPINALSNIGKASKMTFVPTTISLTAAATWNGTLGMSWAAVAATTAVDLSMKVFDFDGTSALPENNLLAIQANAAVAAVYAISIWGYEIPRPKYW